MAKVNETQTATSDLICNARQQPLALHCSFQSSRPVPFETRELLPGDSLITECIFNTVGRTTWTTYGQGTLDEMVSNTR
jgi:hypothetical protein